MKNNYSKFVVCDSPSNQSLQIYDRPVKKVRTAHSSYLKSSAITLMDYSGKSSAKASNAKINSWALSRHEVYRHHSEKHLVEVSNDKNSLKIENGLSLVVEIEEHEDSFVVFNETFGVYGSGQSEEKALVDFKRSFVEFYLSIVETPNEELGNSTIDFKKILEAFASLS